MTRLFRTVLCVIAISLSAVAAARADGDTQQMFFQAVASGDADQLTSLMSPELTRMLDEPVLAVWMQAWNERLGQVTAITETSHSARQTFVGGMLKTTATVQFEHGTAASTLATLDGKLLSFHVQSEQLGDDWFHGPQSTKMYEQLGATFIRKIVANETDSAYDLCHPAVRETVGREAFGELVDEIAKNGGALKSVDFQESYMQITDESQMLVLKYDVACRRASGTCEVKVQFIGMKGYLMGFTFR